MYSALSVISQAFGPASQLRRRGTSPSGSTVFREVMAGPLLLPGEDRSRPLRLELTVTAPGLLRLWGDTEARLDGRVVSPGWADDDSASGVLRIAPITARRIRYQCDFTSADGRRLHLDGWKSISYRHPMRSMTTLPVSVTDDAGLLVGQALLRFDARRDLGTFLASFRHHAGRKLEPDRDPEPLPG